MYMPGLLAFRYFHRLSAEEIAEIVVSETEIHKEKI